MSFAAALEKYRAGETVVNGYKAKYDKYQDDLVTRVKYLEDKKDEMDKKDLGKVQKSKACLLYTSRCV